MLSTQFMTRSVWIVLTTTLLVLAGCATRPVNPPITQTDPGKGYRFETRQVHAKDKENLVVLAFSGGGTRAAAFSYGVLEFLRRTEVIGPRGNKVRLLDEVDVITGVSGGSFTALAYGLYGDKLFADYEQRFLKRDVQGDIIARAFNPGYWPKLSSTGWGRSELASQLYDEILFDGATFGDLDRGTGPLILVSATDISYRFALHVQPGNFRHHLLGPERRSAIACCGGVIRCAGRAITRYDQQLRGHLQLDTSRVGEAVHGVRQPTATRSARHPFVSRRRCLRRQRPSPLPPPRRRRRIR